MLQSKKETVKEIEAKDPTSALLEKQALEGSTTKPQLRSTSLHVSLLIACLFSR